MNYSVFGDSLCVISPHPDDEVLGCGGLIAKLVKKNIRCILQSCFAIEKTKFSMCVFINVYLNSILSSLTVRYSLNWANIVK